MRKCNQASLHVRSWLALALLGGLFGGCAGMESKGELPTVGSVDLARYAGTWYEIARLPMWFQRHCVDSKAVYRVRSDGRIGVHNECGKKKRGRESFWPLKETAATKTGQAP